MAGSECLKCCRNILEKKKYNHLELQPRMVKKRRRFGSRFSLWLILLITILISIVFLSRQDKFLIDQILVSGNEVLEADLIKKTVSEKLDGYYLGLIPKNNILFYPRRELEKDLRESFKRLLVAQVRLDGARNLAAVLKERKIAYLSCQTESQKGKVCYFTDEDGYAFETAPDFGSRLYFEFNGPPLSAKDFKKALLFKAAIESVLEKNALGQKPISLEILEAGDYDLRFDNWHILFNKNQDEATLSRNLDLALNSGSLKESVESKKLDLDYIDLRFNKKVYYKFKKKVVEASW